MSPGLALNAQRAAQAAGEGGPHRADEHTEEELGVGVLLKGVHAARAEIQQAPAAAALPCCRAVRRRVRLRRRRRQWQRMWCYLLVAV
jgi:hypothetical protein